MSLSHQLLGQSREHLVPFGQHFIHPAIQSDLQRLCTAAEDAGFDLTIASSFRDFERQRLIWNNKFLGNRPVLDAIEQPIDIRKLSTLELCHAILRFSALPGASRHHWGTDLDIFDANAVDKKYQLKLEQQEYQANGPFYAFNHWLDLHLGDFGFFRPYARYQGGVASEPWHISHQMQSQLMASAYDLTMLEAQITEHEVEGKTTLLEHLPTIYQTFITNICQP